MNNVHLHKLRALVPILLNFQPGAEKCGLTELKVVSSKMSSENVGCIPQPCSKPPTSAAALNLGCN